MLLNSYNNKYYNNILFNFYKILNIKYLNHKNHLIQLVEQQLKYKIFKIIQQILNNQDEHQ